MNAMGEAVMVGMVSWGYFAHTFLYLIFLSSHVEKIKQKRPNPPYPPLKFWGGLILLWNCTIECTKQKHESIKKRVSVRPKTPDKSYFAQQAGIIKQTPKIYGQNRKPFDK
jgi:hypothetical protein